jgi:DNA sulfur modification protein DndE
MIAPPATLRLSAQERAWLLWIRQKTGALTYALPCRWALALSLAEPSPPPSHALPGGELEISWATLGGRYAPIYWACVVERHGTDAPQALRAHLYRGIGALRSDRRIASPAGLLRTALEGRRALWTGAPRPAG